MTTGERTYTSTSSSGGALALDSTAQAIRDRLPAQLRVDRVAHLASSTLPASGNFTSQTAYTIPQGAKEIFWYISYTKGANGGYPVFKFVWGNGTETAAGASLDAGILPGSPAAGEDLLGYQSLYQAIIQPVAALPNGTSTVTWSFGTPVLGGQSSVQLLAAEKGVTGTPGTISIALSVGF